MYNRIQKFPTRPSIFWNRRLGFQTNVANTDVFFDGTENLEFAKKTVGFCFLLDIRKAFYAKNNEQLLINLAHYGIRGVALDWFCWYHSKRYHHLNIGVAFCCWVAIVGSVPQGSIIDPLFFL